MNNLFKAILLLALSYSFSNADIDPYQVAFETTECNGESGFATVAIESIDKIQTASCLYEGKKLKKLLVRRGSSYVTYTITHAEARVIMQDVKLYNRMRLKMMENSNTLIIDK